MPSPNAAAAGSSPTHARSAKQPSGSAKCLTLDEDEVSQCGLPATKGPPGQRRCNVHHKQYQRLCKDYKAAQARVDTVRDGQLLPTKEQISQINDYSVARQKLKWLEDYVEAIRVERYGRKIHGTRFFLKMDTGHKTRINVLAKEMEKVNELRFLLSTRALDLYADEHPEAEWARRMANGTERSSRGTDPGFSKLKEEAFERGSLPEIDEELDQQMSRLSTSDASVKASSEDDDLIYLKIQADRQKIWYTFQPMFEPEAAAAAMLAELTSLGDTPSQPIIQYHARIASLTTMQYLRRAIFHDSILLYKAIDKVSFRDLFFSKDFNFEDAIDLFVHLLRRYYVGLPWMKDSIYEALEIFHTNDQARTANLGKLENRFQILYGWIYNARHVKPISNEVWWILFQMVGFEQNTENRFVRICNTYDDVIGFLSMASMGVKTKTPKAPAGNRKPLSSSAPRMHLSLSGVIVADMVSPKRAWSSSIAETVIPASRRENVVWAEMEDRAYMFGAVRLDEDPFTDKFLHELRSRPQDFQLLIWNETKPDTSVEEYGSAENGKALPQKRGRLFEAPPHPVPSEGQGPWNPGQRSARDILFSPGGSSVGPRGYISTLRTGEKGWFFSDKKFPVRYIVILDTKPHRDVSTLSLHVAWAALRAGGYGSGEFTMDKYKKASNDMFDKCAKERLAFMKAPFYSTWETTKME